MTELSRPYYVFTANGFEVDIASTAGGIPPVVIDKDDMGPFDYAFLNDKIAQRKVNNTIPIEQVQGEDYQAVFFVGGKGPCLISRTIRLCRNWCARSTSATELSAPCAMALRTM